VTRRVITGVDEHGRSRVVSDAPVPPIVLSSSPTAALFDIWGVDGPAQAPTDGTRPATSSWFPPTVGFRCVVATFPPDSTAPPADVDPDALAHEMEAKVPGAASHYDPDRPGMHTTQTVDLGVVLDGHVVLELDDGEVSLGPGDVVVQNGTRHAWRNRGGSPCTMAFVLIGANIQR
jgi:mannose-6-phosphate isomerase-like protein (cupin superfamily)